MGMGPGEESWLIDRQIIMGRHDDEQTLLRVDEAINKTYTRRNGAEMLGIPYLLGYWRD